MSSKLFSKFSLVYILFSFFGSISSEKAWGCGGFIKSNEKIDFSQVKIKLVTRQEIVKEEVYCAPNGYYFLMLYDKNDYVLKIDPPKGWSFEPTQFELSIDGTNDACSLGKDMNFNFTGFGIVGKVSSKNSVTGSTGVEISLYSEKDERKVIAKTKTIKDGVFSFTPIIPGKYILVASHPTWVMEKDKASVVVKEGNAELRDGNLIVFGYDVRGRVTSEGEPIENVSFLLYKESQNSEVRNCLTTPVKNWKQAQPLCYVTSDKSGRFIFPALTIGNYYIVPFYSGTNTKFDVQPSKLEFKVNHESLILPRNFIVTGFSISGKVQFSKGGKALVKAEIFFGEDKVAVTDENGKFVVENIKSGNYQLHVKAENVIFEKKSVKISPSDPNVPTIFPSFFQVCGKVTMSAKNASQHRKIAVENENFQKIIETDPKTGDFCIFLPPEKYIFNVIVSEEEKNEGLQFFPPQKTIDATLGPIKNVNFSELKATLKGKIECWKGNDCNDVSVTLTLPNGSPLRNVLVKNEKFEFSEILPGNYQVSIDSDVFCWEKSSHEILVSSEIAQVTPFKQAGFSIVIVTSHETQLEYFQKEAKTKKTTLNLIRGQSSYCLPKSGEYIFEPKSCHVFENKILSWNTKDRGTLIFNSKVHLHKGKIIAAGNFSSVQIIILDEENPSVVGPLLGQKIDSENYEYEFEFYAMTGKSYTLSPISNELLFVPRTLKIVGSNDCQGNVSIFVAHLGKIIEGSISPPLNDVSVKIFGKDKKNPVRVLVTKNDGKYEAGPLDAAVDYTITAEKEGYIVTGPGEHGIFVAHKLAKIVVEVFDVSSNVSLQGVLLSLTGGDSYRNNSVTGHGGVMIFNSLSPGTYYLRPVMKEYKFEPSSKMINVEEGSTIKVKLQGTRVAFSAYGVVTSLNGEPESGLLMEAQGQNECSDLQEEATTDQDGKFRIRGLQPTCIYAIRLKPDVEVNSKVQRSAPSSIAVQAVEDVENLRLVVFYPLARMDLTVHLVASHIEHYRSLKIKLCRENRPDSPLHVAKLDQVASLKSDNYNPGHLVHFPSLPISKTGSNRYILQVESSLSRKLHKYETKPVYFEANASFKSVYVEFKTERKLDQSEMSQTSIVALPLIVIVTLAFLYREQLLTIIGDFVEKLSRPTPVLKTPVHAIPVDPRADDIIVEQIMNINKRKTKPRKT